MRPLNSLVSLFSLQLIFLLVPSTMIEKTKAYNIARNYVPDPRISWSTCTYPELTHFLHQLVAKYSTIARLFSIGKSFEGKLILTFPLSHRSVVSETGFSTYRKRPMGCANFWSSPWTPASPSSDQVCREFNREPRSLLLRSSQTHYGKDLTPKSNLRQNFRTKIIQ